MASAAKFPSENQPPRARIRHGETQVTLPTLAEVEALLDAWNEVGPSGADLQEALYGLSEHVPALLALAALGLRVRELGYGSDAARVELAMFWTTNNPAIEDG